MAPGPGGGCRRFGGSRARRPVEQSRLLRPASGPRLQALRPLVPAPTAQPRVQRASTSATGVFSASRSAGSISSGGAWSLDSSPQARDSAARSADRSGRGASSSSLGLGGRTPRPEKLRPRSPSASLAGRQAQPVLPLASVRVGQRLGRKRHWRASGRRHPRLKRPASTSGTVSPVPARAGSARRALPPRLPSRPSDFHVDRSGTSGARCGFIGCHDPLDPVGKAPAGASSRAPAQVRRQPGPRPCSRPKPPAQAPDSGGNSSTTSGSGSTSASGSVLPDPARIVRLNLVLFQTRQLRARPRPPLPARNAAASAAS